MKGITLIEAVVYVALLAIVGMLTTNAYLATTRAFRTLRAERELHQSIEGGFDFMLREIRRAGEVNAAASVFGTHPGTLVLDTASFTLSGGRLTAATGGGGPAPITSESTGITELIFYNVQNATSSEAVHVTMRAGALTLSGTAVLRGSY